MLKTRWTKRTFSSAFKLEAIEQVVKCQRDAKDVALALELNPNHLRKWIRRYKQKFLGIASVGNAITPEQRQIQRLNTMTDRDRIKDGNALAWPNLFKRQRNPVVPNRIGCGGIPFILLWGKGGYLALVIDLYARRIIGSARYIRRRCRFGMPGLA